MQSDLHFLLMSSGKVTVHPVAVPNTRPDRADGNIGVGTVGVTRVTPLVQVGKSPPANRQWRRRTSRRVEHGGPFHDELQATPGQRRRIRPHPTVDLDDPPTIGKPGHTQCLSHLWPSSDGRFSARADSQRIICTSPTGQRLRQRVSHLPIGHGGGLVGTLGARR
ncbi:MAG: hypothetical protein JWM95_3441 [Gemmatimonadetes bacterium]|nr:hypothetical protein [Gemmatimonadota bacterium]